MGQGQRLTTLDPVAIGGWGGLATGGTCNCGAGLRDRAFVGKTRLRIDNSHSDHPEMDNVFIHAGPTVAFSRASNRPACAKRPSSVQVDLPFERSSSSRLARREIDIVETDHRKRSGGPRKPTCSVLDRRNFRNPCSIWWNEDTFNTNKCSRQLVTIRRSEAEGPRRRVVGGYLGCERSREPTEVGSSTLSSPAGRGWWNIDSYGERTAERQLRATSRHCLRRPQACARGRRRPQACARGRRW